MCSGTMQARAHATASKRAKAAATRANEAVRGLDDDGCVGIGSDRSLRPSHTMVQKKKSDCASELKHLAELGRRHAHVTGEYRREVAMGEAYRAGDFRDGQVRIVK